MSKLRVLVLGREVSDFMCPVFAAMRSRYPVQADLLELRSKDELKPCAGESFDNVLDISLRMDAYSKAFVLQALFSGYFLKQLFATGSIMHALKKAVLNKKLQPVIAAYDVVHVYFVTPELFSFFDAISSARRLVVSMWGSDILHSNADFDYPRQVKMAKRADVVTVHHKEMRELFLSKFGRELENKVRDILVVDDLSFLELIAEKAKNRDEVIADFKTRHGINASKRIIVIGHAAHEIDNHLPIISSLALLKEHIADKVCLVFPLTYGRNKENYIEEIKAACDSMGVQSILLTEYLSNEEMLELRIVSEIHIRLSKMDAFSLALCETLCSGGVVVTGTWLPYGKLRGNGVHLEEIYNIPDVAEKVVNILDNYTSFRSLCSANAERVINVFQKEKGVEKIYKSYINE